MIDPENAPVEYLAPWARDPRRPRLAEIRRGVLYVELDWRVPIAALALARVELVLAALGPRLFFGRADGPFVPYDVKLVDQNTGKKVEERAWPFSLGDELWVAAEWDAQALFVHLSRGDSDFGEHGSDLYLGRPGELPAMVEAVRRIAERVASPHVSDLTRSFKVRAPGRA